MSREKIKIFRLQLPFKAKGSILEETVSELTEGVKKPADLKRRAVRNQFCESEKSVSISSGGTAAIIG